MVLCPNSRCVFNIMSVQMVANCYEQHRNACIYNFSSASEHSFGRIFSSHLATWQTCNHNTDSGTEFEHEDALRLFS